MRQRSRRFALLVLVSGASVLSRARAEGDDKLFLEFGAGVGLTAGRHAYGGTGYPNVRTYTGELVAGPVVDATLTPAYGWSNFALGIAFDAWFPFTVSSEACGGFVPSASAIAMTRTKSGFGGAIALGYASTSEGCSEGLAINYNGGFVPTDHRLEGMAGPRAAVRFGYIWPLGVGFYTTASYAYLTGDDSNYAPLTLVLQAMLSGW